MTSESNLDPNFKLEPSAYDKVDAAADTTVGNPKLTPSLIDAKPSTDLKIVGSTADLNTGNSQNPNLTPSTSPSVPKQADPIIFQTAIGDKIPDALTNIMLMSKAVHEDMMNVDNTDPNNPKTYAPRISSTLSTDPNTKEQIVTYHIEKFTRPMKPGADVATPSGSSSSTGTNGGTTAQSNQQAEDFSKLPDVLEYDYIYTGVNVDVIQFDMNVKLAFNSLKSIQVVHPTASNTNKDILPDNETTTNKKPNTNAGEARDTSTSRVRSNSILADTPNDHVGLTTVDPLRTGSGSLSPETLFAARKNISDQISNMLTSTNSTLKIVGNPLLLAGYVLPSDTYSDPSPSAVKAKKDEHAAKTGANQSGLLKVRINIRSPKPSYMQGAILGDNDNFYSTPFWMDKLHFTIKKITSKFTKGEFVQFLELQSMADQSNTKEGTIAGKNPPKKSTSVSKPADSAINETKGANVKAFLEMLSHAEGTYGRGDNGYNVRWTGVLFEGYATHPWHVKPWSTSGTKHTPAGKYQILVGTFDGLKASCGGDFSPSSQDRMAISLMKSKGAYDLVVQGKPAEAIRKLPGTWSSLKAHSEATLLKWYEQHGGTYKPQTVDELPSSSTTPSTNDTQVPSGTRGTGSTKSLNDSLVSGTNNALDKGVKYELGARDPNSGKVDCSGWVLANTKEAAANANDPNITDGYNLMKKGNTAAGIVQTVGNASGQELTGSSVNTDNLKPGMVIGVDYGAGSTGAGRYKGIDHIVQVIQDPNTGKLQISESASSAGGIRVQDAGTWLNKRKNFPKYAVDPFYKAR
jgi:muramidase (phage lysozyme)